MQQNQVLDGALRHSITLAEMTKESRAGEDGGEEWCRIEERSWIAMR